MKHPAVLLAATSSGSGKTLITCALLQALKNRGHNVSAFKCGPDYIDPMFHTKVIGVPSKNLDLYFTDEETTKALYAKGVKDTQISVIEGVMGLFDGVGGITEQASAYHLACTLKVPVVLIVNAKGMGRSVLAQIAGFLQMDRANLIAGIILNQVSESYYQTLKPMIEDELNIKVFGFYPTLKDVTIESRHLGLKMPNEIEDLMLMTQKAAGQLENTVELDSILEIAGQAGEICVDGLAKDADLEKKSVKIAVARDEAFCFYYQDNLEMLENLGAKLLPFSPVHDTKLPEGISGILLGGGYPELVMDKLSANKQMLESIRQAADNDIPIIAECGGFMYLHEAIEDDKGNEYPLLGIIKGKVTYKGKLVRFGYVEICDTESKFLKDNNAIKGHEFHYYDSDNNGVDANACKPVSGRSWKCEHISSNRFMGFGHLYYPSNPEFSARFVEACKAYEIETGD